MYPRLVLAKTLLKESGIIFVSIDDNEYSNLSLIMNEIFGEGNHLIDFTKFRIKVVNLQMQFKQVTIIY